MNGKLLTAFLVVAAVTQGCVVYTNDRDGGGGGNPNPALPGAVTITWSFAGQSCADIPQIKSVKVTIPNEALQNNGIYPCTAAGYPGITLHDFAPGVYSYTVTALSYTDEAMFNGSGTFTVDGDTRATIDLTPVGGPTSFAYLKWKFPANQTAQSPDCTQAGITTVDASIDGAPFTTLQCTDGRIDPGVRTPYIEPGAHTISLVARGSNGFAYYRFDGNLTTYNGAPVSAEYTMNWAVGGAALKWSLTNGSLAETCNQAQIDTISVDFRDANGNYLYAPNGDPYSCNAGGATYDFLPPGTYQVFVWGYDSMNRLYISNETNPPVLTVQAGVFVTSNNAMNVQLFRK